MFGLNLLLVDPDNIQVHLSNSSAPIFKPVSIYELVDVEAVLLCIAFEKLSLCNYIVLPGAESRGKVVQVNGQSCLHRATTRNHGVGLKHTLDDAEGIVERTVHLVQHVVVRALYVCACGLKPYTLMRHERLSTSI